MSQNPFERFDIDPALGPLAITERLRELAEEARPEERAAIRAAWEELTLHPLRRLRAALWARPESRPPLGAPPPPPSSAPDAGALELADLAARPSVARALGAAPPAAPAPEPPLDDDPILRRALDVP